MPLHVPEFKTAGHLHIPPGLASDPHLIVPDDVVADCVKAYNLATSSLRGIDPMCGVGTIPRVITALGGSCDALEIDMHQYTVAKKELPKKVTIIHTDCFTYRPAKPYDYIYTSAPMAWFKHYPGGITSQLAQTLKRLLKPGGLLIMDSDDVTHRGEESWLVAEAQIEYLTAHGFQFKEAKKFVVSPAPKDCDTTFVELVFSFAS